MYKRVLAKKKEIKRKTKKLVKHEYPIGPSGRNESRRQTRKSIHIVLSFRKSEYECKFNCCFFWFHKSSNTIMIVFVRTLGIEAE